MATSAALTNADILNLIFECYGRDDRTTLARAAHVCVAFHEPAIRWLWRDLDSLVPLLCLLPSSWTGVEACTFTHRNEVHYDTYMLSGTVEQGEWERMRERAGCVQTLNRKVFADFWINGLGTWAYLSHLAQGRPLLPNLRRLGCCLGLPQSTMMVYPLLSPNLTHLHILCGTQAESNVGEWECSLRSLLHVVCSIATRLDQIDFEIGRGCSPSFPLTIFSPIQKLKSLRFVYWTVTSIVDLDTLRSVFSGMKSLEVIQITSRDIPENMMVHARRRLLGTPGWNLHNLRELDVTLGLPPTMTDELYNCLQSPNLRKLCDYDYRVANVREVVPGFTTIGRCFPHLQWLHVEMTCDLQPGDPASQESFTLGLIVQSLSKLRAITFLQLTIDGLTDASTDADIHALAEAFPLLTHLWINHALSTGVFSPAALVSLATHCPRLEDLRLPSLYIPESNSSRLADYPVLDHSLRTMSFLSFNAADCRYAALLIDRFFPHLEIGRWMGNFEDSWTQTCKQVEALQAARRQHEQRLGIVSTSQLHGKPVCATNV